MSTAHTITHHPDEDLLLAYASGAANEAIALVVATHLAFCPRCRRAVADAERTGGALLAAIDPIALSDTALPSVLARLDEPVRRERRKMPDSGADPHIPEPLRSYAGNLSRGWLPLGPGLAHRPLLRRGKTSVRLIRAEPGVSVPRHTHHGSEFTLVLSGGFRDGGERFGPGDLQSATPELTHQPVADPDEICLNLAVTDAPLRFFAALPKLVGKVFGI